MPRKADALVIADARGNYYVLPREVVEMSKVDAKAKAAVKRQVGRVRKQIELGGGYSFVGAIVLTKEAQLSHFTPEVAWPNAPAARRAPPKTIIMK